MSEETEKVTPCPVCRGNGISKAWGAMTAIAVAMIGPQATVCGRCKGTGIEPPRC